MTDFIEKYPFVEIIQTIHETTFQPVTIKFRTGEKVSFKFNRTDDYLEEIIEYEIQKHIIYQREKKLERILR